MSTLRVPRSFFVVGLLSLVTWLGDARAAEESNTLNLGTGTQKVINIAGVTKIAPGDSSVASVRNIGSNQLLISAVGEGRTTLLLIKANGQQITYVINVRKVDAEGLSKEIRSLINEVEGVSIRVVAERVILEGSVYTQADAERVNQVAALYGDRAVNMVKTAPNAKKLSAATLTQQFQKAGLKNVQANVVGSSIFLEGSVESPQDVDKANLIVKAMGEKVENLLVVGIKRMILSEVQFVEIRRNEKDRYGIKYPTDIAGNIAASTVITKDLIPSGPIDMTARASTSVSPEFAIGFQNNDGYGRLLAQPRLVCASGAEAEFTAGGEVPIPLVTQQQFTVEYKPYGVILKLKPTADRAGNIQTEITAEVSEVDPSVAVSVGGSVSVPGFRTRKVKTNVTVRHGETIVLSGVFSHDETKSVSKLPGLGHLPIIGELFKNRAFDTTKRELVIFVTPRIVNPDSDKIRTLIEDVKSRYLQARGEVTFGIFD
ncbi:MAG: pilus assembly protein N-terminal domain-containing protein [Myxococcaceae bacterium]|nr:pilus assembly protein N-terminal domain-containing protein [Myxococcaceae bacterium]